jgi:hypothetical protein
LLLAEGIGEDQLLVEAVAGIASIVLVLVVVTAAAVGRIGRSNAGHSVLSNALFSIMAYGMLADERAYLSSCFPTLNVLVGPDVMARLVDSQLPHFATNMVDGYTSFRIHVSSEEQFPFATSRLFGARTDDSRELFPPSQRRDT